jgi:hypothetical protein
MIPNARMIIEELVRFGHDRKEAEQMIWEHMAPVLANLIHHRQMDKEQRECLLKRGCNRLSEYSPASTEEMKERLRRWRIVMLES